MRSPGTERTINIGEIIIETKEYAVSTDYQIKLLDDLKSKKELGHSLIKPDRNYLFRN